MFKRSFFSSLPEEGFFRVQSVGKRQEWTQVQPPPISFVFYQLRLEHTNSSPASVLVSGTIVSNNTGAGREGEPIFVQLGDQPPLLVALSDAFGKFHIRIWIRDADKDIPISLCHGGTFSSERLMTGGALVQRHSLTQQIQAALKRS